MTSRSPSGAAHPGNGLIAPFHDGRLRSRGVKGTRRPPFSAPPARRRPSETAIRTASPALTPKPSGRAAQTGAEATRGRLRDGTGRRGPGPACAVRAQRDKIRLCSIRAIPPRTMRARVTSPKRLPHPARGGAAAPHPPTPPCQEAHPRPWAFSAVSGRCRRARMRGTGPARAVLHIRSGSAGGGSAESCGNAPTLNIGEILPCAESSCLHMGARSLKTDIPGRAA